MMALTPLLVRNNTDAFLRLDGPELSGLIWVATLNNADNWSRVPRNWAMLTQSSKGLTTPIRYRSTYQKFAMAPAGVKESFSVPTTLRRQPERIISVGMRRRNSKKKGYIGVGTNIAD
jgi:hypothetical protein